jgi:hypothetical protein
MKKSLKDYAGMNKADLWKIFNASKAPKFEDISGWEFRGWNHPAFASLLGIRKFIKGFFRKDGKIPMGYNIPAAQNGADGQWMAKPSEENPNRFGFYTVKPVDMKSAENLHGNALLLNYGEGGNPFIGFTWVLRDYVVQPDPDDVDHLLGFAYIALGPLRIKSNFFILERRRESTLK